LDPIEQSIKGVQSLVGSKTNKITSFTDNYEGEESEKIEELSLSLSDEELLSLADRWTLDYQGYEAGIKLRQQANKTYYLGQQKEGTAYGTDGGPISANLLFEAEETFLPAALSKNPEPVVWSDNTAEGVKVSSDVKTMLQFHADTLILRRKLTLMVRHWSIYFLGVIKHGWDKEINDIKSEVRDPRKFIFDKNGYVDCYGDFVGYLGERITVTAEQLIELFPKFKEYITVMVDGKLGTEVTYTEWWTDEYTFCTFKGKVLDKARNPHFNYDKKQKDTDEFGNEIENEVKGVNHFAKAKKPYTFLSVFTLGEQPHDVTNLIEQNIPNQRRVTQRTEQIEYNLSRANNSDIFSEDNFNQETAKQASTAMRKGHPVLVPKGRPISEAIDRLPAPALHDSFFSSLENDKNDLRTIFGTQGITATPTDEDQTARGMILNHQYDNSRIGGGIGDALEQVADNIFNWWVQLYYVYYDVPHFAAVMGQMKAVEYVTFSQSNLNRRLVVSVSADSMKPKDEITEMNQAMALWESGAIDPKTLLTILNFPDPQTTAAQAVLWKTNPQLYVQLNFPDLAQQTQQAMAPMQGAQGAPPPEAMSEPPQQLGGVPASPSLSSVPINTSALPQ
jgi:hypothetical protein